MKHLIALTVGALALLTVVSAPALARETAPALDNLEYRGAQSLTAPAAEIIQPVAPATTWKGYACLGGTLFALLFIGAVTENLHNTFDANYLVLTALPAAGATVHSTSINLNAVTGGRIPRVELDVQCPATPALVDTKNIVFTVEDSADNVTFAAVADLPTIDILGAGGVGAAAFDRRFKLPIGVRQYLRVSATADAAAGNSTGLNYQFALVF